MQNIWTLPCSRDSLYGLLWLGVAVEGEDGVDFCAVCYEGEAMVLSPCCQFFDQYLDVIQHHIVVGITHTGTRIQYKANILPFLAVWNKLCNDNQTKAPHSLHNYAVVILLRTAHRYLLNEIIFVYNQDENSSNFTKMSIN